MMVDELNADIDRLNASIISLGEDAGVTDVTDVCCGDDGGCESEEARNKMKHLII